MKMHRETLRNYLHNQLLVNAIVQKRDVDGHRKKMLDAMQVLREAGVAEHVVAAVQAKCEEYKAVSQGYGRLLEDTFSTSWQMEAVIRKYVACCDDDIDRLPEYVER